MSSEQKDDNLAPAQRSISCNQCRKRKVKCSGEKPTCDHCSRRRQPCVYDESIKRRGPDKKPGGRMERRRLANEIAHPLRSIPDAAPVVGPSRMARDEARDVRQSQAESRRPSDWSTSSASDPYRVSGIVMRHKPSDLALHISPPPLRPPELDSSSSNASSTIGFSHLGGPHYPNSFGPPPSFPPGHPGLPTPPQTSAGPWSNDFFLSSHLYSDPALSSKSFPFGFSASSFPGSEQATPPLLSNHSRDTHHGLLLSSSSVNPHTPLYTPPGRVDDARDDWWTWILNGYSTDLDQASQHVTGMCQEFFSDSHTWLNSLNPAFFFQSLLRPTRSFPRQPHLVLAMLAHVTFRRSNNDIPAQMRAMRFVEECRSLIEFSLNSGSKCPSLAQAATILAVFEFQPHFRHSAERAGDALIFLDRVGMACWDIHLDKDALGIPLPRPASILMDVPVSADKAGINEHIVKWEISPPWDIFATIGETRKEEMRRMCWTGISMAAALSIWRSTVRQPPIDTHLRRPAELLYPGEALLRSRGRGNSGRGSPWALYHRVSALWHSVVREDLSEETRDHLFDQINNYLWQAKDWTLACRRRLGIIDPAGIAPWFERQLGILRAFANSENGHPRPRDRPLYGWWYLLQGFNAVDLGTRQSTHRQMAEEVVGLCLTALNEIIAKYPCEGLAKFIYALRMKKGVLRL